MKRLFPILFLSLVVSGCIKKTDELVVYVNPMIGTAPSKTISSIKHGLGTENNAQVIPSVTVPFGMTNWTPQTRNVETKCVAPYYYKDSLVTGIRGSHWLSGSCTQDYGSFTIMPVTGELNCLPDLRGSKFSHSKEISTTYYYSVFLEKYNMNCELTATKRCGYLRFDFNNSDKKYIVLEPNSDENEGFIKIDPENNEIVGYNPVHRIYQGWGEQAGFSGYFVAQFDQPFESYGIYEGENLLNGETEKRNKAKIGSYVKFSNKTSKVINIKVGTSFVSIENARKNLDAEIGKSEFEEIKNSLKDYWEELLSTVQVTTNNLDDKVKFYTAMYHSFQHPRTYNDVDGSYPSFDGGKEIMNSGYKNYYCDFSVWDTYRALHPLFNILIPETSKDMIRSLLAKARQGSWLPIFPCWNSYTSAMIGDHVISIIADAYIKGIVNLSVKDYFYLKQNATKSPEKFEDYLQGKGRRALKSYTEFGFVPLDDEVKESFHKEEQVSRTLEYAYDDFALSQIASKLGLEEDYKLFFNRSKNYKNVFDKSVNSVRGKFADGEFSDEFIKTERMPYITEGTPWQYTWYVPQDVEGLIDLMGGKEKFNKELDNFFSTGNYWHGNEPGNQIPFLYTYSGEPEKTSQIVGKILNEEYSAEPGGLSGNDDAGQMSAWYVFASMGLYPVCPGSDVYSIFIPSFEKTTINLSNGKTFSIIARGLNSNSKIKTIKLNNRILTNNFILHSDIKGGGNLEFILE